MVSRQSLVLAPQNFAEIFNNLECVGNVLEDLGKASGSVIQNKAGKKYRYAPFHWFEFPCTSIVAEPLVFVRSTTSAPELLINPDVWAFL